MARTSFGTRGGTLLDYGSSTGDFACRISSKAGPYNSLDDLNRALQEEIDAGFESSVPECTTCEFMLDAHVMLPLRTPITGPYASGGESDLPERFKLNRSNVDDEGGQDYPIASIYDILSTADKRERQIVQRAASRGVMLAIERTDGFKYSFNNAWEAKDEDGLRFSYTCQDSLQNKDRHANGFTKTQKHLTGFGVPGVRKPTYDCKGAVSVKFSAARACVDVYYRHYAIHKSVADRRPPVRDAPKKRLGPRKTKSLGGAIADATEDTGGLLGQLQAEQAADIVGYSAPQARQIESPMSPPARHEPSNIGRPLKRKRVSEPAKQESDEPLSLMELLAQSRSAASLVAIGPPPAPTSASGPLQYDLPPWQAPRPVAKAPPAPSMVSPPPPSWLTATPYRQTDAPRGSPHPPVQPYPPPAQAPPTSLVKPPAPGKPKPQGLFQTLRPVPRGAGAQHLTYDPAKQGNYMVKGRLSCLNCRVAKKKVSLFSCFYLISICVVSYSLADLAAKCDEVRPACGSCRDKGLTRCTFPESNRGLRTLETDLTTHAYQENPTSAGPAPIVPKQYSAYQTQPNYYLGQPSGVLAPPSLPAAPMPGPDPGSWLQQQVEAMARMQSPTVTSGQTAASTASKRQ